MKLWIARDKDGDLYVYQNKPIKRGLAGLFECQCENEEAEKIEDLHYLFPSVTWENSPQEMELVSKEEYKRLKEIEEIHKKEGGPGDWYII